MNGHKQLIFSVDKNIAKLVLFLRTDTFNSTDRLSSFFPGKCCHLFVILVLF